MNRLRQFGGILIAIGVVVGLKFYNKSSDHDDIRAQLVVLCESDKDCTAAVDQHFDSCFDDNYSLGGKRRSGGLNQEAFLSCFNTKSGKVHFSTKASEATATVTETPPPDTSAATSSAAP